MLKQIKNKLNNIHIPEERAILFVCLGIALIFWFLVKFSQPYKSLKAVGIEVEMAEDMTLVERPPSDIKAELSGSGWDLLYEYLSSSTIPLEIDMLHSNTVDLNRGQLRTEISKNLASGNLEILEVNYDKVNLQLEEKLQKKLPVSLNASISYAAEYQGQGPMVLTPDSVLVTGPTSKVESLTYWPSDSLILKDLQASKSIELKLSQAVDEISLFPTYVVVNIPVEQFTEKSIFVPLQVINAPTSDSLKVFPDKIKINCVVGLSQYDTLTSNDFSIEVDLKTVRLNEGKNSVPINITRQPDYVKNVILSPKSAEFFILKREKKDGVD